MNITIEMTLYPLSEGYEEKVKDFLRRINGYPNISILTNRMSTYIKGEYNEVFTMIQNELREAFERSSDYSVVMKIIPQDLDMNQGYITFN